MNYSNVRYDELIKKAKTDFVLDTENRLLHNPFVHMLSQYDKAAPPQHLLIIPARLLATLSMLFRVIYDRESE
jgi:hypothetical protein